ncbi:SUKH-4 family immunity protein [Dactylosporangium maewongense]
MEGFLRWDETWTADTPRQAVARVLDAKLDELTDSGTLSVKPPASLALWRIPEEDKRILRTYGMPRIVQPDSLLRVGAAFQGSADPGYSAGNVTGYVIAECLDVLLVSCESTGAVFAVPPVRDLPPALAHQHPNGIPDELVNSSTGAFVQFAWRWCRLAAILIREQEIADAADVTAWRAAGESGDAVRDIDFHGTYRALCHIVREQFRAWDPVAVASDQSMWSNMIGGFE